MSYTRGPWKVDKGCFTVRAECLPVVAATGLDHGVVCVAVQSTSDARLIAAAPDLLCAMQELFEQCAMIHRYGGDACNQKEADAAIKAGLAAIAKATGGEVTQ